MMNDIKKRRSRSKSRIRNRIKSKSKRKIRIGAGLIGALEGETYAGDGRMLVRS